MIDISAIYDKPINFLIGSGASHGLFPTLKLGIKDELGDGYTVETLAADLRDEKLSALSVHYYTSCIRPAQMFRPSEIPHTDQDKLNVISNYEELLRTIVKILERRSPRDPRCNIFTTNYDGCFQYAAESLITNGSTDFVLNDGTVGFSRKVLQPRAFNSYLSRTGIFERGFMTIPQINLLHLHGSVYWSKDGNDVVVRYEASAEDLVTQELRDGLTKFSNDLLDEEKYLHDLEIDVGLRPQLDLFIEKYKKLPIVNPRKWKFHETVFEEHYYHMLRMLSYELEKPNSVLITFGFSFADEHILSLVKRSLANTSLQIFICCFDRESATSMEAKFAGHSNVKILHDDAPIDFSRFNAEVFKAPELPVAREAAA